MRKVIMSILLLLLIVTQSFESESFCNSDPSRYLSDNLDNLVVLDKYAIKDIDDNIIENISFKFSYSKELKYKNSKIKIYSYVFNNKLDLKDYLNKYQKSIDDDPALFYATINDTYTITSYIAYVWGNVYFYDDLKLIRYEFHCEAIIEGQFRRMLVKKLKSSGGERLL